MQDAFSLLYPSGCQEEESETFAAAVLHDLKVDSLLKLPALSAVPWNQSQGLERYVTKNTRVIRYRQDILEDLLNYPALCSAIEDTVPKLLNIQELCRQRITDTDTTSSLYSIAEIELYTDCMDTMAQSLDGLPLKSEGLLAFRDRIHTICTGGEYTHLKSETGKMTHSIRNIKSVTIGVNLDAQMHPIEAGVLSVNEQHFRSGDIVDRLLRADITNDGYICKTPLVPYGKNCSDANKAAYLTAMNRALDKLLNSAVRHWQPVIRTYISHHTDFICTLIQDLRFYLGAVDLFRRLKNRGFPIGKPVICEKEKKKYTLSGFYNPYVALSDNAPTCSKMVLNDITFDENGGIYLLTGPNQGGKSVITYAVGMTQVLFQMGLYVPAVSAELSPVDHLFLHFPASDNLVVSKGRLGEECSRLQQMFQVITPYSLVLMDETFSSTSAMEASYIAGEVLTGLSMTGCHALFATHLHDLTQKVAELNKTVFHGSVIDNLVVGMRNAETGERSYQLMRTKPDGLSYAKTLAEKYGITLEQIQNNRQGL